MAEKSDKGLGSAPNLPVTVLTHEGGGAGLTPEDFKQLKEKYGLDVRIRTTKPGLQEIMDAAAEVSGYDRTYPGYDRNYDKS